MMFRTHVLFTLLIGLLLFSEFNDWRFFLFLFIGSFVPDLDLNRGKIGRRVIGSRIIEFLFGHRGFFHSLWMGIIAAVFLGVFFSYSFIFLIGFLSHIVLDMFTKRGIRLFYPIEFNINGNIKTNGIFEKIVYVSLFFINAALIVRYLS